MAYMTLIAVFLLAGSMLLGESLTEGLISMGITPCGIGVLEVIILQFILFSAFFSNLYTTVEIKFLCVRLAFSIVFIFIV